MRSYKKNRLFFGISCILMLSLGVLACVDETRELDPPDPPVDEPSFDCEADTAGFSECHGDRVIWCRGVNGLPAQFIKGDRCRSLGMDCYDNSSHQAACVHRTETCTTAECDEESNIAYSCLDGKKMVEYCGWYQKCVVRGSKAYCDAGDQLVSSLDDTGVVQYDLDYVCTSYRENKGQYLSSVATTAATAMNSEIALNKPITITLGKDSEGYVGFFPGYNYAGANRGGRFVVFLDTEDVFDSLSKTDGSTVLTTEGDEDISCGAVLTEQYVTVGELTAGTNYAVKLVNTDTSNPVKFTMMVSRITDRDEVDCEAAKYKVYYEMAGIRGFVPGQTVELEDEDGNLQTVEVKLDAEYTSGAYRAMFNTPVAVTLKPAGKTKVKDDSSSAVDGKKEVDITGTNYVNFFFSILDADDKPIVEAREVEILLTKADVISKLKVVQVDVIPGETDEDPPTYEIIEVDLNDDGSTNSVCGTSATEKILVQTYTTVPLTPKYSGSGQPTRFFAIGLDNSNTGEDAENIVVTMLLRLKEKP